MAFRNYDELQDAIKDYTLRNDLPVKQFITLAESEFNPIIKHYLMEKSVTVDTSTDRLAFPDDLNEVRSIWVNDKVTQAVSSLNSNLPHGQVGHFYEGNFIVFVGMNGPAKVKIVYSGRIPNLTDTNPTNWLLTKFPTVYLHAALIQAYRWMKEPEEEQKETANYQNAISILTEDNRRLTRSGPTVISGGNSLW